MERIPALAWISVVCLLSGGVLNAYSWLPYGASFAERHNVIGPFIVLGAYVLWLAEVKPTSLYFGVAFGGSVALIDSDRVVVGLIGAALVCAARVLQYIIEKQERASNGYKEPD